MWMIFVMLGCVLFGVMGLLFVVFGIWGTVVGWVTIWTSKPVRAVIVSNVIDEKPITTDDGGCTRIYYTPTIEYRYEVDGTSYTDRHVFPRAKEWRHSRKWAETLAARFKVGEAVEAYYDPKHPSEAFLIKRKWSVTLLFATFVGCAIYGFATFFSMGAGVLRYFLMITGIIAPVIIILLVWVIPTVAAKKRSQSAP